MIKKIIAIILTSFTLFTYFSIATPVYARADADWFVAQSPVISTDESDTFTVSSAFWVTRSIGSSPHGGSDIISTRGREQSLKTKIYSMANGRVVEVNDGCPTIGHINSSCGNYRGNYVVVYHGVHKVMDINNQEKVSDIFTAYVHLARGTVSHLSKGDSVSAGDYLGDLASSGSSSGPHLHIEVAAPGDVGENGRWHNDTTGKTDPMPYIWPEGAYQETGTAFLGEPKLYNALGEFQGEGAQPSGIGSSGGGENGIYNAIANINDEWMTPKVNFIDRTYIANTRGVSTSDSALLEPTTLVGFTRFANNVYHWSFTATLFLSILFLIYMSLVTIYYLVLLPRSNTSWKLADLFEKTTGIDAVVTKKNTLDIIGRDLVAILFIAIVLSGAYTHLYNLIYSLVLQIF